MTEIPTVTTNKVLEYLKANAPDLAALMAKDMTASDAHQTTALGNQRKSKKVSFADALKDGKKPKVVPDDGPAANDTTTKRDADWSLPFEIMKAVPDQQLVFGWASISTKDGKIVVDKQDDMILPEDLEKAAYDFVLYCRSQGDMHKAGENDQPVQVGRLVESMMFTKEKQDILKIDLGLEGWWVGFKVDDAKLWEMHKRGERAEFSIGGRGKRVPV